MNTIEQTRGTATKSKSTTGGDDDIPYYDRRAAKKAKLAEEDASLQAQSLAFADDDDDDDGERFVSMKGKSKAAKFIADSDDDSVDEEAVLGRMAGIDEGMEAEADDMLARAAGRKMQKDSDKQERRDSFLKEYVVVVVVKLVWLENNFINVCYLQQIG